MAAVNKGNQEEWGEEQEHKIFILVHPSSMATSVLCKQQRFSLKQITRSVYNPCSQQVTNCPQQ